MIENVEYLSLLIIPLFILFYGRAMAEATAPEDPR